MMSLRSFSRPVAALKWPLLNQLVCIFNAAVKELELCIPMLYHKTRSKNLYYSIGKGFISTEFNGLINEDRRAKLLTVCQY